MGSYTYGDLQTRISAEIQDTTNAGVTLTQVKQAIISAIEYYERERNWFSETVTRSLVTVANAPAVAVPTDMVRIDTLQIAATSTMTATTTSGSANLTACTSTPSTGLFLTGTGIPANTLVKSAATTTTVMMDIFGAPALATASGSITVTIAAGSRYTLEPIPYSDYTARAGTSPTGAFPTQYSYYRDRLYLFPTPNAVYSLIMGYVQRLTALSATSDNNGWTNYCEPLIRSRAKWDIFSNLLYFPDMAKAAKQEELDTLNALDIERYQRNTMGRTKAVYL